MTLPSPPAAGTKSIHWSVKRNYSLRVWSFLGTFVVISTYFWGKDYGPLVWLLLVVQFLIYPHVMYWRTARAADARAAERTNLVVDTALIGLWMGALGFPLAITCMLSISALVNNTASNGFKGLAQGMMALALGIVVSIAFFGWRFAPQTDWITTLLTIVAGEAYLIAVGLAVFDANQRLIAIRMKVSEANRALEFARQDAVKSLATVQTILDTAPIGICLVDGNLKVTHVNRRYLQDSGWSIDQLLGHTNVRFFRSKDEFDQFNARSYPSLVVGETYSEDIQMLNHRGDLAWRHVQVKAVDPQDLKQGFVVSTEDISDRKKDEQALLASHQALSESNRSLDLAKREAVISLAKVQSILDTAPVGLCLLDGTLRITHVNQKFLQDTGWTAAELLGHTHQRFFSSMDEFQQFVGGTEKTLLAGETFSDERQLRHRNGHLMWIYTQVNAVDPGDFEMGFVIAMVNITRRKNAEQEIVRSHQALQASQTQVVRLLDNSGEGFLTFGADLRIDAQYSLACESMLGRSPAGYRVNDLFYPDDPVKAELMDTIITSVLAESSADTRETMLSLLPREVATRGLILKADYKILNQSQFMVVLTDITAERRMAELLSKERQRLELIVMAVSDSRNFFETIDAFREFLRAGLPNMLCSDQAPQVLAKALYREIHTYKGLLSQFSFPNTPKMLHCIESQLSALLEREGAFNAQALVDFVSPTVLEHPFDADLAVLADALGDDFLSRGGAIVLSDAQARELERLALQLLRGETVDTSVAEIRRLLQEFCTLRKVAFRDVLLGFDGLVKLAAQRLEKEVAPIQVDGGHDVWIDPAAYRPFLRSLVHVFRNAVAHGIESPEARWEAEKDEVGRINCSVESNGNTISLCIADDGAGLNLTALRARAVQGGIYAQDEVAQVPDETIAQLIFRDTISTQHAVTDLAGRGVGLAAVLSETRKAGGEVRVRTVSGQGTQFLFTLPLKPFLPKE